MESDVIGTRFGSRKAQSSLPNAGAISTFNPTSLITTNGGFWRADMGVTGNPSVTQWNDQSSFASNLTVPGGQSSPQFSSTGFNGAKPGISYSDNSTNSLMFAWTSGGFSSTTVTAFFLFEHLTSSLGSGRNISFFGGGSGQDFNNGASFAGSDAAGANSWSMFGNSAEIGNGGATGPTLTNTNLYLLGIVFDGAHANKWSAGAVEGSGSTWSSTLGGAGTSTYFLGRNPVSNSQAMAVAFAGITYKAMNSTDWTNLKNWSNSNWGTSF